MILIIAVGSLYASSTQLETTADRPDTLSSMAPHNRILILAEVSKTGGTRTFARELQAASGPPEFNMDFHLFSIGEERDAAGDFPGLPQDSVFHIRKSWWPRYILPGWLALRNVCQKTGPNDIVILSTGVPGLFFAPWVRRRRVFYFIHTYPHSRFHRYFGRLFGLLIPRNWNLVTVSNFSAQWISKMWHLSRRNIPVSVVWPGIRFRASEAPAELDKKASGVTKVLCVAACVEYKNPGLWLDVATEAHEGAPGQFHFTWVGGGPLLEQMRQAVESRGLEKTVEFVGHSDNPEKYYGVADVYLQLSAIESFGLSLVEAASHGIPSVVSNIGGMAEIVHDGQSGYVIEPGNSVETYRALTMLVSGSDKQKRFGENAKRIYEEDFSHDVWVKRIRKMISSANASES